MCYYGNGKGLSLACPHYGGTRWVVNFMLWLLYISERTLVHIAYEAGWAQEPDWTFWRIENSLSHTGMLTLDHPACNVVTLLCYPGSILSQYAVIHFCIVDQFCWVPLSKKFSVQLLNFYVAALKFTIVTVIIGLVTFVEQEFLIIMILICKVSYLF